MQCHCKKKDYFEINNLANGRVIRHFLLFSHAFCKGHNNNKKYRYFVLRNYNQDYKLTYVSKNERAFLYSIKEIGCSERESVYVCVRV